MRLGLEVIDPQTDRLRLLPAIFWKSLHPDLLRLFAYGTARWGIVTAELVAWMKDRIAGRRAIEVGAGRGDPGRTPGVSVELSEPAEPGEEQIARPAEQGRGGPDTRGGDARATGVEAGAPGAEA